ncbi:ABC transporter permease [Natranaerobius thermophilus]|uniref:ABC transporter permease n=1 Tax=Natranaerobius thermophilus TaxID=375929 RepID=UPI0039C89547
MKNLGFRRFVLRRIGQVIISLFIVATIVFFLFRLLPGDPTAAMMQPEMSSEAQEMIRERFGLDRPLHEQYLAYMVNLLQGDFGISFHYRLPVSQVIGTYILNTLWLMFSAIAVAYIGGVLIGGLMSWYRGSRLETFLSGGVLFCRSLPPFFLGMVGIMVFSFYFELLPHSGMRSPGANPVGFVETYLNLDFLYHLILPVAMSSLYYLARPTLIMRNNMLELRGADFVELARAKGLRQSRVIYLHAARNAILPVITNLALFLGMAIGAAVAVEYVFGWPGLGREMVRAAQLRDYPLAQACFLMLAAKVMVLNLLVDILYGYLDPRITYE